MDSNVLLRISLGTLLVAASGKWLGCGDSSSTGTIRDGDVANGTGGVTVSVGAGGVSGEAGGARASSDGADIKGGGAGAGAEVGGSLGGATDGTGGRRPDRDATAGNDGTNAGKGGDHAENGGAGAGTGGGSTEVGTPGADCPAGAWPTADPAAAGPFATTTENNVGPTAGVGADGGPPPQFTLFRPKDMAQGGLCHPVITWGNGTGANPSMYKVLLNHLASHGFVVIASNSPNVGQGNPAPMVVGVTWVLEQNDDPSSALYRRIDSTRVGATGHSQGAMATSQAAGDSHITVNVPIEGAQPQKKLHGPAMFFCGGQDTIVGCSGAQKALDAVTTQPAMLAQYLSADHGSWMSFMGSKPSPVETAITAWMRVHLMDDASLRPWFYGASCKLCQDSAWQISQKNMDQ